MDQWVVLYDQDCGFCRWATGKLLAWDRRGRLRSVALQSSETDQMLPGMGRDQQMAAWHLLTPNGRVRSAGRAVAPLLRLLPGGRPLAVVAESFPGTTDRLYDWISRHRERMGSLLGAQRCAVQPSGEGDERSTRRV
jgi:predicted DCC family thiol-disulfide oxidoreductase YuxK